MRGSRATKRGILPADEYPDHASGVRTGATAVTASDPGAQPATARLDNVRIVLVEPSHPGNIGGAARALKTMGLRQLVLVNPLRFPDPQADWRAAGARDLLDHTQIVDSLDAAIGPCQWVVGTSTRSRRIPWPVLDATEVAHELTARRADTQVALLFGREDKGLTNEELQRCHAHLQIPANPDYPVLNLAMAVQIVCYELYQACVAPQADTGALWDRPLATSAQLEGLFGHLNTVLADADFVDPANPGQALTRLRRLLTRVHLDETEVQMLRGVLQHLHTPWREGYRRPGADGSDEPAGA